MRGFIEAYRLVSSVLVEVANLGRDLRDATTGTISRHIDFFYDGWKPRALFLRLPFTNISVWLEWSEVPVGWGCAANAPSDREVYRGRVRGVLSVG